jgi:hypothetical protein
MPCQNRRRHPATRPSASTYTRSTSSAGGGQALCVAATTPISRESPSTVYGAVYRLQPVDPPTASSANLALGGTASQPVDVEPGGEKPGHAHKRRRFGLLLLASTCSPARQERCRPAMRAVPKPECNRSSSRSDIASRSTPPTRSPARGAATNGEESRRHGGPPRSGGSDLARVRDRASAAAAPPARRPDSARRARLPRRRGRGNGRLHHGVGDERAQVRPRNPPAPVVQSWPLALARPSITVS